MREWIKDDDKADGWAPVEFTVLVMAQVVLVLGLVVSMIW